MIKQAMNINASGSIIVYAIKDNERRVLVARSNTVLAQAKYIITRLLMNDLTVKLSNIRVFNGGLLLATGPITNFEYVGPNEFKAEALFNEASFNGSFTKLTLSPADPATTGDFSEVIGLDLSKLDTEQILISWDIKIL